MKKAVFFDLDQVLIASAGGQTVWNALAEKSRFRFAARPLTASELCRHYIYANQYLGPYLRGQAKTAEFLEELSFLTAYSDTAEALVEDVCRIQGVFAANLAVMQKLQQDPSCVVGILAEALPIQVHMLHRDHPEIFVGIENNLEIFSYEPDVQALKSDGPGIYKTVRSALSGFGRRIDQMKVYVVDANADHGKHAEAAGMHFIHLPPGADLEAALAAQEIVSKPISPARPQRKL